MTTATLDELRNELEAMKFDDLCSENADAMYYCSGRKAEMRIAISRKRRQIAGIERMARLMQHLWDWCETEGLPHYAAADVIPEHGVNRRQIAWLAEWKADWEAALDNANGT